MEKFFIYIIEASVCLSLFYLIYLLILRKETSFKWLRFYLVGSIFLSFLLPFNKYSIELPARNLEMKQEKVEATSPLVSYSQNSLNTESLQKVPNIESGNIDYLQIAKSIYFVIVLFFLLRLTFSVLIIWKRYLTSEKIIVNNRVVLVSEKNKAPFSFMDLIFINQEVLTSDEAKQIINHENIHASQFHTIDILLIESVMAIMWFNPVVWMMRRSLQQIHEYLADEGALNASHDRLEYQALLLNQVAEGRLISLSSRFNQSLIKKRIIMMTTSKIETWTRYKVLALAPLTLALLLAISCMNGTKGDQKMVAAISPTKMNVLYIGVDNPVSIAVAGVDNDKVEVKIDNGKIIGKNGEYIIQPANPKAPANVTLLVDGKEVKKAQFRVKTVPDPVAKIAGIRGSGIIAKDLLLEQKGVVVELENFDFDLHFKTAEFTVTSVVNGKNLELASHSENFTKEQLAFFSSLKSGQHVYIENIKAEGPDGMLRQLGTIALVIK